MLNHRLRILSSLLIAFIIVNIYGHLSDIKNLLSNIKLPTLNLTKLFTLQLNPDDNNLTMKQFNNGSNNSSNFPTAEPIQLIPTNLTNSQPTPTNFNRVPTGSLPTTRPLPTSRPQPTTAPQPTSTPALPPITSDIRPGTTLGEIFDNVSKRMCIPAALLRAFQEEETGPWFNYYDNPVPYNTYGWWTTVAPDPCKGFGYDALTGYVPADSYYANRFCMVTPGANPGIMGLFAIDQWEQDTTRKNTLAILPNNIDRRVIFDSAIIFASATINRVVEPECGEVWSDDVVKTAAAKHVSGQYPCTNTTCEQYSSDILSLYKKYR